MSTYYLYGVPYENNIFLLKDRNIKIGLIIGERNNLMFGKIFLPEQSDGRVEINSALSDDASDTIFLPYGHREIHHKELTLILIKNFLKYGSFEQL